jgi:hypothetical protein
MLAQPSDIPDFSWALETACWQYREWIGQRVKKVGPQIYIRVNLRWKFSARPQTS